jgi:hypothetical protein
MHADGFNNLLARLIRDRRNSFDSISVHTLYWTEHQVELLELPHGHCPNPGFRGLDQYAVLVQRC